MSSIISDVIYFSIDFPWWKVLPYAFISKQSCSAREKKHNVTCHASKPKISFYTFFSNNYHNYSIFRDVPGCSMFWVLSTAQYKWCCAVKRLFWENLLFFRSCFLKVQLYLCIYLFLYLSMYIFYYFLTQKYFSSF